MTRLKLRYDGWLALSAGFREELGLGTGSLLKAELVDGAVVLRPAAGPARKARPEPAT